MNYEKVTIEGKTIKFYIVDCDYYGNPRRIVHYLDFFAEHETETSYEEAKKRAKKVGFSVYRGKKFGGGFVGQCWSEKATAEKIIKNYPANTATA